MAFSKERNHERSSSTSNEIRISLQTNLKSLRPYVDPISRKFGTHLVPNPSETWNHYLNKTLKVPVTTEHVVSTLKLVDGFKTPINGKIIEHLSKYKSKPKNKVYGIAIQLAKGRKDTSHSSRQKSKSKKKKTSRTRIRIKTPKAVKSPTEKQPSPASPTNSMPVLEPQEFVFKTPFPVSPAPLISNIRSLANNPLPSRLRRRRPIPPDPLSLPEEFIDNDLEVIEHNQEDILDQSHFQEQQQNRDLNQFEMQSQCSLFSQEDDIPYQSEGNVQYRKGVDVTERIVESMNKGLSNSHLLRIKKEIDDLKSRGKWLKISSYIPQISILAQVLFSDKNFQQ